MNAQSEFQIQKAPIQEKKIFGVYIKSVLTQKVILHITEVGKNIKQNLEKKLVLLNEGKCISEGYIRPNSVKILSYSSGVVNSENVEFMVVFECLVCHPVQGQKIECIVKGITIASIYAEVVTDGITPIVVYLTREFHKNNNYFDSLKENSKIMVSVVGVIFKLYDPFITVSAELVNPEKERNIERIRQKAGLARLTIGGELEGVLDIDEE
jgi:hypothetical protein